MQDLVPIAVAMITAGFSAPVWSYAAKRFGWGQTEMDRLRAEHRQCEKDVRDLQERIAIIEQHHSSAFARWISDAHRRISWVNSKALVSIFGPLGLSRGDVEGKTWGQIVDAQAATELDRLSHAALAHDGSAVSNLIRLHPDLPIMHIVQIATSGRDGELIFETIAFRMNDPDIVIGLGVARTAQQRARSIDNLSKSEDE